MIAAMNGPVLGIDLGGTKMLMLAALGGEPRIERLATGPAAGIADLEAAIAAFVARLPMPPRAIGIAVPGLVGPAGEVIACDVLPGIVGWRPDQPSHPAPVAVLNDAEAALVEDTCDLAADATAAVVMVGTGIGAAFMAAGRVLRGANGWAGELGSMPLGTAGTLDQLAGGAGVLRRLGLDADAIRRRAEASDTTVIATLRDAGAALGLGLATVINLLNPQRLSLAGGTLALPGYAEAALASAKAHSLPELWSACELRAAPQGALLVAFGAARYAAGKLSSAVPRSAASR